MRRLFFTFARGWPGVGLLLLRLVVGGALIGRAVVRLSGTPSIEIATLSVLAIGAGLFMLLGLWTPVAGTLVALIETLKIVRHLGDPWIYIFLATMGAALAMLGPGLWSIDARLYGWKRISPPAGEN